MAFKKTTPRAAVPDSPEQILLDLPRRKIPGVLLHQGEIIKNYVSDAINKPDVALQLPTGSGKTLVGLLIGEWRRRKFGERVVYLCPTKQLVNQVVEQASGQYGLTINAFTGPKDGYSPSSKAEYQNADRIAVTTYSSLFNTNPYFSDPDLIILDDAHAAENYIADLWSVRIERRKDEHKVLHSALCNVLKPLLDPIDFARLGGKVESSADRGWIDKITTPDFASIRTEFSALMDSHADGLDLYFSWSQLRDHLHACHLYVSSSEILLRPLIPPTWTHVPFVKAKQRIFMTATVSPGGDLERSTGRDKIFRVAVPSGWDRQGIGRRYFVFPGMSLDADIMPKLRALLMRRAGRSLVLVPNDQARDKIAKDIRETLGFKTFSAADIEASKIPFVTEEHAVAVVANRYDGIDFPGDDCRLLFIENLPKATNLQERFIMARLGATILLNDRVQTRIVQAIGRCTRSLTDYSAVVVSGEELPDYLVDRRRRIFLHPELQAEIEFGVEQSQRVTLDDFVENLDIFLKQGADWEDANNQILDKRAVSEQKPFPEIAVLAKVVGQEIEYQRRVWQGDCETALAACERVLSELGPRELRGYQALWHYLAGCAAWQGSQGLFGQSLGQKARYHFSHAKEAAKSVAWLVALARLQNVGAVPDKSDSLVARQLERTEAELARLGILNDREFAKTEKQILEGVESSSSAVFEQAQVKLGQLLGFDAGKEQSDASPDPWWIADSSLCLVFEDHSNGTEMSTIDATKARQVATHVNWVRQNLPLSPDAKVVSVLVTPAKAASTGAMPHLKNVYVWPLDDYKKWTQRALQTLREIRTTFVEAGDFLWRADARKAFEDSGLDALSLVSRLSSRAATEFLKPVKTT